MAPYLGPSQLFVPVLGLGEAIREDRADHSTPIHT